MSRGDSPGAAHPLRQRRSAKFDHLGDDVLGRFQHHEFLPGVSVMTVSGVFSMCSIRSEFRITEARFSLVSLYHV